jgi:hypothetical protein
MSNGDRRIVFAGLTLAAIASCTGGPIDGGDDAGPGIAAKLSSIRSDIFTPNCSATSCHGGANPVQGLDLASDGVRARLVDVDSSVAGQKLVVAGDPDASLLYLAVKEGFSSAGIRQMPPGVELSAEKLEAIRAWIEAGALDD